MTNKKLYRSTTDKMLAGVCGGLAEFSQIDVTVLRLLMAILVICSGFFPGVFLYIVAAIIMPLPPTPPVAETVSTEAKV